MSLNLMTGYAGEPHITSADDGAVNAAIYGASKYVLNTGQKFAYELISNNLIKIKDGYAINQGRKIGQQINDYEELTIDNGLQGVKRSDIIAIRYSKNSDTGIESADFVVIKGTSGDDYKDPTLEVGNIIQGDSVDDLPLYRVKIDGLSITAVEPLFNVLMSMQEMHEELTELNSNLLEKVYPIGSIYLSVNSTNPGTLFGGTWVAWGAGRVPVGVNTSDSNFNTVEKPGGSGSYTYNFTHNHMVGEHVTNTDVISGGGIVAYGSNYTGASLGNMEICTLQPYITCYMWKRTA